MKVQVPKIGVIGKTAYIPPWVIFKWYKRVMPSDTYVAYPYTKNGIVVVPRPCH